MLTHKELVDLIYDSDKPCTCPIEVCDKSTCEECAERITAEYEQKIRTEYGEKILAEIQSYFSHS